MKEYVIGAVQGYLEMQGLTDISNLNVTFDMDDQAETDAVNITADSYTYDSASVTGLDITWSFDYDGQLTTLADTGIDTLGISGITEESIEMWYQYSDPENNDEYAKSAAEELLRQVGIENFNNVDASASFDEDGNDNITINLDQNIDFQSESGIYVYEISLQFSSEGSIVTKSGIPTALEGAFSDSALEVWYEYSGPDQQRQKDQQDGGYYEGHESHTESYSNVYTFEDWEGTVWTVVDKDEDGVWTSTQTGSNGDARTQSSSWDHSTQSNTFTEVYVSESRGINSTMVEVSSPNGVTKTYTGTADGIGWMPLHQIYTDLNVVETLDQYWNTTNISGSGVDSDGNTVAFTYEDYELKVDGESVQADFGFDDFFGGDQGSHEWEWVDDWNNTIWVVVEEDVSGVWTMTETAYSMDDSGNRGDPTGDTRIGYSSWNDETQENTWSMTEVSEQNGYNFTRVEVFNESTGASSETITGTYDHIGWFYLGKNYNNIDATVVRDANWNVTSITGTVQDPDNESSTLDVTFANNSLLIDGKSVDDWEDSQPHFKEGESNEWSWTDWDGVEWTVVDEVDESGQWKSTETSSNGDVRTHTSSWDDSTGTSAMTETYVSGNLELNYSRTEIWNNDGTSSVAITGSTDQLGWMWLDGIYDDVNVTIEQTWDGMTLNGVGTSQESKSVTFSLNEYEELLIDGEVVQFGDHMDFNFNESQSWESSWEWVDWDGTIWVVTDSQEGETWTSTEIAYTEDESGARTETGAERVHSSTWNERTQTNIWTDSEKTADGSSDYKRVETQRADGTSTEKITGKIDKFSGYESVDITIERDNTWNITGVSGTADGEDISYNSETGNIEIGGTPIQNFDAGGGHANKETSENSWTWTDWEGITWTVTDKQEGDTWTSTERGDNGDVRIHKNTWTGETETWSDTFTTADGSIDVTRVEVRNSNDNTSTETITGKDNHFGWWDFETAFEGLEVTIERDSNWNITDVSGTANGVTSFGFEDGQLTIDGDVYQSGGNDRANLMQEAYVNTWEWQDGNGVTWTVTDKQDGDTWTSTEEGSNGDVRINSSSWDSDVDDYVYTTSFKSGSDDRDFSIRETWNADGSSTEVIKGTTDEINWTYLGEIYSNVDVTIVRNQNWEVQSISGSGTNSDNITADFGWDSESYLIVFNDQTIANNNYGSGGQEQESWETEWEWVDWDGTVWTVTESQVGDVWTSTEVSSGGAERVFKSSWDPVKQVSIWSESYDQDYSSNDDGGLDYTRVETYNPNGTSSETITGTTDNIAWYPLHGMYTDVSVTIERDSSWNIYKVSGTGTDAEGVTADFGWSNDQITFGDNNIQNADDFKVNENQYWENTSSWEDWDGTTWEVTEIQDGETYTRTEINSARGDSRTESSVWDHDTQTNTWTMNETNVERGIDVTEVAIWDSASETETKTITGSTDHIDWMPLNGVREVSVTLTFDSKHNVTDATGTVTMDDGVKQLSYNNGQYLFDGEPMSVSWTDWDDTVWEMTQTQDGETMTRTETATAGPRLGAERVETHSWNHEEQQQTRTERFTNENNEIITDVTSIQSFSEDGSLEVLTGSTNHIDWMQLGEIYTNVNINIERDNNWNIQSIEGTATNSADQTVTLGFSPNENQLTIDGQLVAADIGHSFENTWEYEDVQGVNWTVVEEHKGNTWTSTETADNGDVRVYSGSWDEENQTNTWSESFTSADGAIDFVKTEVYNENTQTATITTTGKSDHIGWKYIGETYTNINVTEAMDSNWNTTSLSGTATNAAGEVVTFGWDDGEITVDGAVLAIHGPGDFSMSADNFQNEWSYFDHEGIEWFVVESQKGDAWVSEETSEFGDERVFSNYWDDDAQESTNITKFKSADGDIKYKLTETWSADGSSTLTVEGDTDHIGWDYVGQVYTDIDVVITRNSNWEIQSVTNSDGGTATATDPDSDEKLEISFDANNDITIDGVSIYRMGDDFYKNFDQDMMNQLDQMQTGSWEFEFTNHEGHLIKVVEESVATDIVSIETAELDITLVFDLGEDSEGGEGQGVSIISSKGIPDGLSGFDYDSLEVWYNDTVDAMDAAAPNEHISDEEEAELINQILIPAVESYLNANSISIDSLNVDFAIADTFTTKETNQTTGDIYLRSRTENLGSETEREENFRSEQDYENNNPYWWAERVRSYEDSEYGFKETSVETSSDGAEVNGQWYGKELTIETNYAPDGTTSMVASGTEVMGGGEQLFIMTDIQVTSVIEDGWKYTDFFGTGTIVGVGEMAWANGMEGVITSHGTDPNGGPLIHITVAKPDGTFFEMSMYDMNDKRMGELSEMGNPLDRYVIKEDEGFQSSKNFNWDQTSFIENTEQGTTQFEGTDSSQTLTVEVTEVRTYNDGGMLEEIEQTVVSTKGDIGESYTRTFTLNDRFDVIIELTGNKVIRGEAYKNIDMETEITPNGDVRIEGTANKLDGTQVDFFKGHHDHSMEIVSINRDGTIQKLTEDELDASSPGAQAPVNELMYWEYTDHEGTLWTVIDKFDGQTRASTETTAAGDVRTFTDTWTDDGGYSFVMTEELIGQPVRVESRSGTPQFADGKYQEVETVTITEDGETVESYTQTLVFNEDYSATRTLEGTLTFMGETYTEANVVIEQNEQWVATSVSGTAKNSADETATITMDGTHPWGDPKLVFTVGETAISDTRTVIDGKDTSNANDPVAVADSEEINENQAIVIDVLSNDTDADGDTLSIKSVGDASYGEVNLASGQIIYTPNYGYSGDDEFTYTVTDGKGGTNQGTVSITVNGVNSTPVAVDDSFSFLQGSGTAVLDVLANDTDADGDDVSLYGVYPSFPPTKTEESGKVSVFGGIVNYSPVNDDFVGEDTFLYYVTDGATDENGDIIYDEGSVTIIYESLNNAPVAVADSVTLSEDIDSVLLDVLSNDTDADGDALTIESFTNPSDGTARLMGGALFYTPDENFSGSDSMTYTVTDPSGASATETVTLTITEENDAPVTTTDVLNVEENSADGITVNLLSNDYDREEDDFSLTSIGAASNGTAVMNNDGTVTYTPDADYTGADEFSYVVTDDAGAKATGTVSITVSVVNGAPVTTADISTVTEDSSSNRISVLNNDTDPENNTLTLDSVTTPTYGTVSIANNVALYTPEANYSGEDSFSYWVTDGEGGSTKGEVTVTVTAINDAPTAVDDTLGTISATRPTTLDLLANDTDPDGDSLTVTSVGEAEYGNVTISGGSVRFNATRGSSGNSDSFEYTIEDADGETSTATAYFTLSSNTNPNAINDKVTFLEDGDAAEVEVLDNDTDSDGDSVTVLKINTDPLYGSAEVSNGKIFYAPTANYNGTDSFTYIVKDGQGGRDEATVIISITSVNDAPTAVNDTVTVDYGSSDNVIGLLDNDSDVDGDDLSIDSVTDALFGTVTLNEGVVTYTPNDDYAGTDSFTYILSDGNDTSSGKVNITVSEGNTLPTVVSDTVTVDEDSKNQTIDVLSNDSDADNDDLSVASVTQAENGTVTLSAGSVLYTPDADFSGKDNFTYTVTDGNGGISSGRVAVTVTAVEDDPTATNDVLDPVEAGSAKIEVDLISNDLDVDGDSITITSVGDALYGTTTYTSGTIYYQPGSDVQSDVFSYTLADANGNEATGYASVEVIAANNAPTGAVTITGGTQPYQTLTVSNTLADADGIAGEFSYQWYADDNAIIGETGTTYTVALENIGTAYSVKASYTDEVGNAESKTSDATNAVTALDQPFSFVAGDVAEDGTLTLTLKADVEAIYSRSDITGLTGADLSMDIDWDLFSTLDGSDAKYSISDKLSGTIILESSSESATDSFDTITLASLRLTDPLLTLADTDTTNDESTGVTTTADLLTVTLKPTDPTAKVAISLSGTIEANQGQVSFSQYDATTSNITGVAENSDPEGSVSFSGTVAVDEVLTASHSLTDADGMRAVSYQWLRDGVAITGETDSTYTITTADINTALSVQASYTDGGGTAETATSSSSTVTQTLTNKPFMFESELITASEASTALYGADYSENSNETILKLTLSGDITNFDEDYGALYTSVAGAELDVSLDWDQFEAIEYNDGTSETFEINKDYTGKIFLGTVTNDDGEFSKIVFSSLNTSSKPVLTLIDSVTSTGRGETDRPTEVDLATIYLNPIDSVDDVEITFGGIVSANQGDDSFTQLSHSLEVVTKTYDAIISTAATDTTITKLTGTSVNLWKDGADTGTSVAVDSGEISIDNTVAFDAVKLSETDAYDFDINISDAIDVLRHIVDLEPLTADTAGYHAADVDNNGTVNISDAIDVLRHIVDLETIDTFDVLDSNGARITELDAEASGEAPTWTLVANGDVDMSGSYDATYVTTVDIV